MLPLNDYVLISVASPTMASRLDAVKNQYVLCSGVLRINRLSLRLLLLLY